MTIITCIHFYEFYYIGERKKEMLPEVLYRFL